MLKLKCCFGVVMAGAAALGWAAAERAAAVVHSAATSVSARNGCTRMDPPPLEAHAVSDFICLLYWSSGARRAGFRHPPGERGAVYVDRTVRIRSVKVRVAERIERVGDDRVAGGARARRLAVARRRRAGQRRARHVEAVALF